MSRNLIQTNIRIRKINRLIQEEIGKIIQEEIEMPRGTIATITSVETSIDVTHAKINVSVVPRENTNHIMKILTKNIFRIQNMLNKKLVLKFVPQIKFSVDKTQDQIERIEMLLNRGKKK